MVARILLVLLAALVLQAQASAIQPCARPRSRFARQRLQELVFSPAEKFGVEVPSATCPWHPARDRLKGDDEQRTVNGVFTRFTCKLCNKSFRTEYHLDLHFDNRHNTSALGGPDVCLADYCDLLQCQPFTDRDMNEFNIEQQLQLNNELCKSKGGIKQRKAFCEMVIHSCFPLDKGGSVAKLNNHLKKSICDQMTCQTSYKPLPWYRGRLAQVLWLVLGIMLAVFMVLYYLVIYLNKREFTTNEDLVRRRHRSSGVPQNRPTSSRTLNVLATGVEEIRRRIQRPATFN